MFYRAMLALGLLSSTVFAEAVEGNVSANGRFRVIEAQHKQHTVLMLENMIDHQSKLLVQLPGDNQFPVWSPDNNFIAFCASYKERYFITVTDLTGHSWMVSEIYGGCNQPAWSPDSISLAFTSLTKIGDRDVYIATAGGTDHRNLTHSAGVDECEPVWSMSQKTWYYRERCSAAKPDSK